MSNRPLDCVLDALRAKGYQPRKTGAGWSCRCPSHDDKHPSLSITEGDDGRALVHCHAGCAPEAIIGIVGLSMRDLMPGSAQTPSAKRSSKPSKVFDAAQAAVAELERRQGRKADHRAAYRDAHGVTVGEVLRWNKPSGKRQAIWPIARAGKGWVIGGMPEPRPLYRLPELVATPPGAWLYIVEGEAKADKAAEIGLVVTTSPHGSQSAGIADWSPTRERVAVIVPDLDRAGEGYAAEVARLAFAAGADSVRIVRLPGLADGDDIADFIAAQRSAGASDDTIREEIQALAEAATPLEPMAVEPNAQAPGFAPIDVADLIRDYPKLRPPIVGDDDAGKTLLRGGEVMNLVAAPKARKTWLAHSLAVAVATGEQWLGFRTTGRNVLLIDAELHKETLSHRLSRTLRAAGVDPAGIAGKLHTWPVRGLGFTIEQLPDLLRSVRPGEYGLIVVDALYRFLPTDGKEGENSNALITRVYNALDQLAEQLQAAIVIVHHTTKGDQSGKSVTDVGAGGGAQSRAADVHAVLRPHKEDGAVVFEVELRSSKPIGAFVLEWRDPGWGLDTKGRDPADIKRPSKKAKEAGAGKAAKAVWTAEAFDTKFIKANPRSLDSIQVEAQAAGISMALAKKLVNAAVDDGLAHRWEYSNSNRIDFANRPQPVTATSDPVGVCVSRAHPPTPPRGGTSRSGAGRNGRERKRRRPAQKPPNEPPADGGPL